MSAILDFQLQVSHPGVGVGFVELLGPENDGLAVGILFLQFPKAEL